MSSLLQANSTQEYQTVDELAVTPASSDAGALLPRGLQRAQSYFEQTKALKQKYPGVIIVPGMAALADYLRYHTWTQSEVLAAFPWKVKLFRRTAGRTLPFILNTEQVREAFPDLFYEMDNEHKNALKLFSPEDLKDWFRSNLVSTVQTVLVPLTLFADNPDAMRRVFKQCKAKYLTQAYECKSRQELRKIRLSVWPEIQQHIRRELREQVGKFFDDADAAAASQGVQPTRAHFKPYEVKLPADKMPVFFEKKDIGKTRNYDSEEVSYSTYKFFGWAEHAFRDGIDPDMSARKKAYTQGLWIGGKDCLEDYRTGLLELMTAERFADVFGASALQNADWRFSAELCTWAEPKASFGPGFPPKELSVLLGINRVAPKEK